MHIIQRCYIVLRITTKQVKKNAKTIEKEENKTREPEKEDLASTQAQRPLKDSDLEEDLGQTRKIDSEDIRKVKEDLEEKSQNKEDIEKKSKAKLEVLGKLPKYEIGALDVQKKNRRRQGDPPPSFL